MVPAIIRNSSSTSCLMWGEVGIGQCVGGEAPLSVDRGESSTRVIGFGGESSVRHSVQFLRGMTLSFESKR